MTEENPIIEEIRRTRERLLAKHNGDLDLLVTYLQESSAARAPLAQSSMVSSEQANPREPVVAKND